MTATSLIDDTCELQLATRTEDGYGQSTIAWGLRVGPMSCRLQPLSSRDANDYMRAGRETTHVLYCNTHQATPTGTTYTTISDIIKNGGEHRIKYIRNGQTRYFEVEGALDFDERGRLSRLDLVERDVGWLQE